jgi:hypothetical protein
MLDVELVSQMSTTMFGSKESHTGYIYKRVEKSSASCVSSHLVDSQCDPKFVHAINTIGKGTSELKKEIQKKINNAFDSPSTRSGGRGKRSADT